MNFELLHGDCLELMKSLPDESVDAVVTDPPYPMIDRPYGKMTVSEWQSMMYEHIIPHVKRVLKPSGSAVFILQPNMEKVGVMRSWLWEIMVFITRTWNLIQDVYWWNITTIPNVYVRRDIGLLRSSVKYCVWCGPSNCYRNQSAVLWSESFSQTQFRTENRAKNVREDRPSGNSINKLRTIQISEERGGVTPYNLLPIANSDSVSSGGAYGHPAATPLLLMDWWVRYITRPNDLVLDPFMGSGTTGVACRQLGRRFIGMELHEEYFKIAHQRILGEAWEEYVGEEVVKESGSRKADEQLDLFRGTRNELSY